MKNCKLIHVLAVFMIVLAAIISAVGLFSANLAEAVSTVNRFGDTVKLYGSGIYSYDSHFKAPILRGTDLIVLFVLCPALFIALLSDIKLKSVASRTVLISLFAVMTYYGANISLGVSYNSLHLLYTALFSLSFFGLIAGFMNIDLNSLENSKTKVFPRHGIYIFLILSGLALFAAWLPDIVSAFSAGRPIALIETYTTEITYVLDMGIVSPAIFICVYLLKRGRGLAFVLLQSILSCCGIIGLMVISQTVFQYTNGIDLPIPALITKSGTFVMLAAFSFYFSVKNIKAINSTKA